MKGDKLIDKRVPNSEEIAVAAVVKEKSEEKQKQKIIKALCERFPEIEESKIKNAVEEYHKKNNEELVVEAISQKLRTEKLEKQVEVYKDGIRCDLD